MVVSFEGSFPWGAVRLLTRQTPAPALFFPSSTNFFEKFENRSLGVIRLTLFDFS